MRRIPAEPVPVARRLPAHERRASILEVASELFAERGLHGVSVDEIAQGVGVSPAVLYRHFSSKESLYTEVLHYLACQREDYVQVVVQSTGSFPEVLRGLARIFAEGIRQHPALLRLELFSLLEGHAAAREFFDIRWKMFTDYIEITLEERNRQGNGPGVGPRAAALMFQGMLREVLMVKCLPESGRFEALALDTLVDEAVTLFLAVIGETAQAPVSDQ